MTEGENPFAEPENQRKTAGKLSLLPSAFGIHLPHQRKARVTNVRSLVPPDGEIAVRAAVLRGQRSTGDRSGDNVSDAVHRVPVRNQV